MPPDAPKNYIIREEVEPEKIETEEEKELKWKEMAELKKLYANKYTDFLNALQEKKWIELEEALKWEEKEKERREKLK